MACGKPVVVSDISPVKFVKENDLGLLVHPKNLQEISKAIITLLQDKNLARKMGEKGRQFVERKHSWEVVAKKLFSILKRIKEEW